MTVNTAELGTSNAIIADELEETGSFFIIGRILNMNGSALPITSVTSLEIGVKER